MTRKDFQLVADILKLHVASHTAQAMALDFAQAFQKTNPRFDKKRFLDACGLEFVRLGNGRELHIIEGK
jgi:hypothetical protein